MLSGLQLMIISVFFVVFQTFTAETVSSNELYRFRSPDRQILGTDDGSSLEISLDPPFPFYGKSYNVCRVQNNGIISLSLRHPPEHFIRDPFPLQDFILIAPFYGDVDTRRGGETWYTEPVSTDNNTLQRAKEDIKPIFSGCYDTFSLKYVVTATWYQVGYFKEQTDKLNTFQCILTTDGVQSFAIFLYNEIQWVLEYDPSSPARVGFSDGISNKSYEVPASGTPEIINITKSSNVERPGVWVFRIDGDEIPSTNLMTEEQSCPPDATENSAISGKRQTSAFLVLLISLLSYYL